VKKRILIVDDEPDIREFISYNLFKYGYEVEQATNGSEALQMAHDFQPDLILMDIMMPVMNGFEACRKLREEECFNKTFIIFLSALSEPLARTAGHHIFVDGYIHKPVPIKTLISEVDKYLKKAS
jgi:two-component system, OmpR family, alkaline phosphatase synthesis response regulator PhoP